MGRSGLVYGRIMDHKQVGCEKVDWIYIAQDMDNFITQTR
jgi:hypothetical protein